MLFANLFEVKGKIFVISVKSCFIDDVSGCTADDVLKFDTSLPFNDESLLTADMVSGFSKDIYSKYHEGKPVRDETVNKLILNVKDKSNYVVHIRNLKYYLEKGLVLKHVNRCIKFKQSTWLKPWIDFNTEKRKKRINQ